MSTDWVFLQISIDYCEWLHCAEKWVWLLRRHPACWQHTQCVWQCLIYNCQKVADLWYHGKTQASINLALIQRQTLCERDGREAALLVCCDGVLEKTRALTMFACHLNLVCWHSGAAGNNNRSATARVKITARPTQQEKLQLSDHKIPCVQFAEHTGFSRWIYPSFCTFLG